jgi:hypothetical protein
MNVIWPKLIRPLDKLTIDDIPPMPDAWREPPDEKEAVGASRQADGSDSSEESGLDSSKETAAGAQSPSSSSFLHTPSQLTGNNRIRGGADLHAGLWTTCKKHLLPGHARRRPPQTAAMTRMYRALRIKGAGDAEEQAEAGGREGDGREGREGRTSRCRRCRS